MSAFGGKGDIGACPQDVCILTQTRHARWLSVFDLDQGVAIWTRHSLGHEGKRFYCR
jgi:hypothetical protein